MSIDWCVGSGFVEIDGKSLEWSTFGATPQHDPVIVMLHEGLGCVQLWRAFPALVASDCAHPVLAFSRAGYGQSDAAELPRPLDYMTREATVIIPQLLDAIGAERYVLLGHSDGATIAAEYAGRVVDPRLCGLVLIAPHFFTEPEGLAEIRRIRESFADGNLRKRMARYHRNAEATFRGWNDAWLDPGFAVWNVVAVIDRFAVPALVIQGIQDPYGTPAQADVVANRSRFPVETLMLENCGHSPHIEQTARTVTAVTRFVMNFTRTATAIA